MDETPEIARLAEYLKALGNPNRLELLYALRAPRAVSEIELHPEQAREGENPERPISHQAVRDHLAKLRAIGVVAVQRTERGGNIVDEYVLNHQKLFAIVEELRMLGELRAQAAPAAEPTIAGAERAPTQARDEGPRFVLVRGQGEGRVFPLRKETLGADRGWIIGRKRGLAVSLDYDPFVSAENAEVLLNGAGFSLVDIRSSRNGTMLNFKPLPRGGSAPLASGDIVTIGRTNLVFRVG
ncbi:MAG TPA: FHA domain-containing protein [Candidatus Thermoplasmatota archaeon]|jgi:DNA-binding transcriptional ArsR family regulator|nr:FHA domain-containing protein [Candidatus Thermoplasmatota archaeon]